MAKIRDVARFAPDVLGTMPIKDPCLASGPTTELPKPHLFRKPYLRLRGVAENEEIEMAQRADGLKGLVDRLETCKDALWCFIVRGHQEGCAGRERGGSL
jgi:hypothetical protein